MVKYNEDGSTASLGVIPTPAITGVRKKKPADALNNLVNKARTGKKKKKKT